MYNEVRTAGIIDEIYDERNRQVADEGWTVEHDDTHDGGELAVAAGCYAISSAVEPMPTEIISWWPWDKKWWKPTNPRRDLIKAAALIVAEIERIDRIESE